MKEKQTKGFKLKYVKVMKPLSRGTRAKNLISFDIETYGLFNEFLMGSISYIDKGVNRHQENILVTKTFWNKQEMIDYFLTEPRFRNRSTIVFAHNLQFDYLALFGDDKYMGKTKLLMRNGKFLLARLDINDKQCIRFYDTFNHAQLSLAKIGDILGFPKYDKPIFLGEIPKDKAEEKILEDYNIRDSELGLKFALFLQDNYNKIGCNMKCTLPSSSLDLFKRKYLREMIKQPEEKYLRKFYEAYYGGRTEVIKRGKIEDCFLYDINSLYPYAMTYNNFPNPNYAYYKKFRFGQSFKQIENYQGISRVDMTCPEDLHIPYLPVRKDKLLFPTGVIKGWYTNFEIREAIKFGYKLNRVHEMFYYTKTHMPFRNFVLDMYNARIQNIKTPMQLSYKLLMNSLYGKFAQKIDHEPEIRHIDSFENNEFIELWNSDTQLNIIGNYAYIKHPCTKIPNYINPIYSIHITAFARDVLYKKIPDDVYYMDTDSCITKEELPTGMFLGEWKKEANIKEGLIVKPKFYYRDEVAKVKGCGNISVEDVKKLIDTRKYSFQKIAKFKESLRRDLKFNQRMEVEKNLSLEDSKREWVGEFNPKKLEISKPLILSESDYT